MNIATECFQVALTGLIKFKLCDEYKSGVIILKSTPF